MKKVIKMNDLDAVKQQKEIEKKCEKAFDKNCLICNQVMEYIDDLTWYCKRCDTLTKISHVVVLRDEERDNKIGRTRFIE